jgi:hypothetical protein
MELRLAELLATTDFSSLGTRDSDFKPERAPGVNDGVGKPRLLMTSGVSERGLKVRVAGLGRNCIGLKVESGVTGVGRLLMDVTMEDGF